MSTVTACQTPGCGSDEVCNMHVHCADLNVMNTTNILCVRNMYTHNTNIACVQLRGSGICSNMDFLWDRSFMLWIWSKRTHHEYAELMWKWSHIIDCGAHREEQHIFIAYQNRHHSECSKDLRADGRAKSVRNPLCEGFSRTWVWMNIEWVFTA